MTTNKRKWKATHKLGLALIVMLLLLVVTLETTYQVYAQRLAKPPAPNSRPLPRTTAHAIWAFVGGEGRIQVKPYYSWTILRAASRLMWSSMLSSSHRDLNIKISGGYALSSFAIRAHASNIWRRQRSAMFGWHGNWITMTIWATRHWNANQALNAVAGQLHFGNNILGIRKAAQAYYNKRLRSLTADEAAFLMVVTLSPVRFLRRNRPDAVKRRNALLNVMFTNGGISRTQLIAALKAPIRLLGR